MLNNGDKKKLASAHSLMEEALAQTGSFDVIQSAKTEVTQDAKSRELHHLVQPEAFKKPSGGSNAKQPLTSVTYCSVISSSDPRPF